MKMIDYQMEVRFNPSTDVCIQLNLRYGTLFYFFNGLGFPSEHNKHIVAVWRLKKFKNKL